jgi:hypothetical protein
MGPAIRRVAPWMTPIVLSEKSTVILGSWLDTALVGSQYRGPLAAS